MKDENIALIQMIATTIFLVFCVIVFLLKCRADIKTSQSMPQIEENTRRIAEAMERAYPPMPPNISTGNFVSGIIH